MQNGWTNIIQTQKASNTHTHTHTRGMTQKRIFKIQDLSNILSFSSKAYLKFKIKKKSGRMGGTLAKIERGWDSNTGHWYHHHNTSQFTSNNSC